MIKKLYHFLGGIKFALFLIGFTALFVILGTFIESKTDSHLFAAQMTYENPIFNFLIMGYFVNILFSAIRRWPFKRKHIPFLLTHLALLMILSGVMAKNFYGTQGVMQLIEGSGSDKISIKNHHFIHIEKENESFQIALHDQKLNDINFTITGYLPHSEETFETFIKGNIGFLFGAKPFPLNPESSKLKSHASISLLSDYPDFKILAVKAEKKTPFEIAEEVYLNQTKVEIKNRKDQELIYSGTLQKEIDTKQLKVEIDLNFNSIKLDQLDHPDILVNIYENLKKVNSINVPLSGPSALINQPNRSQGFRKLSHSIDLKAEPTLLFIKDSNQDLFVFVFDKSGRVLESTFRKGEIHSFIAYDKGFKGYSFPFNFPIYRETRDEIEKIQRLTLKKRLEKATQLPPPLELLKIASSNAKLSFPDLLVAYLEVIDQSEDYLYGGNFDLPPLDLELIPKEEMKSSALMSLFYPTLEKNWLAGHDFIQLLEWMHWPFVDNFKTHHENSIHDNSLDALFSKLNLQIYSLSELLPDLKINNFNRFYSAYLKLYDIDLQKLQENPTLEPIDVSIEAPLTVKREKRSPLTKLEDNRPLIRFKLNDEEMMLSLDPFSTSLKMPTKDGNFLVSFRPEIKEIPYRVRLRQARQIKYPNSPQNLSFEADLLVLDKKSGIESETTISMNRVYETDRGYRFYLSQVSPGTQGEIQKIQLIVNHDPMKYYLTYPGVILLSIGIILVFWFYSQKKD